MGIVLSEPPDPKQTMEFSRFLMSVYRSQFEGADGKISITSNLRFVDEHVSETIHRLNAVLHILHFCEIHLISIIFEMAGLSPKFKSEKVGTHDNLISPLQMFLPLEIL